MKITSKETIRTSEREFIDNINAELDWESIETLLFEKHQFTLEEDVEYKKGDLVVYNDQIAYRFDFHIKVPLSVVFGRDGNCLEISTSGSLEKESTPDIPDPDIPLEDSIPVHNIRGGKISSGMASIAEMISDINQETNDE